MKKQLTEIIFILDKSGSMYPVVDDTIGGFNSTIEKQKEIEGECLISTILFNNDSQTLHDRVNLQTIKPLTKKDYEVSGCTALLDAVGDAINLISTVHKYIREEDKPEKTMFIITTDGMENASRKFSYQDIKKLISSKQEEGWEFIFLGANIDAYEEGKKFGLEEDHICEYRQDAEGVKQQYARMEKVMKQVRRDRKVDLSWKD